MRNYSLSIPFLFFSIFIFCQKTESAEFIKTEKRDTCHSYLNKLVNKQFVKKIENGFVIKTNKGTLKFVNNNSDENYIQYEFEGTFQFYHNFDLIKVTEYNGEYYFLISKESGKKYKLNGFPIFSSDYKYFATVNIPYTDEKQIIEIYSYDFDKISLIKKLENISEHFIFRIVCINISFVFVEDNNKQIFKIKID
ncbi:hypothetical protein GCM10010992_11940 [Cloacibacterium rupense]|uniref:Outer membrane lipoprotein carrier protein LolA n=1 Tax=Cloacibacterium rupense TaxID=517423 RepID=A0ABQ2NHI4_9FLAO|nr:hypothetical protein GCM10010992_11940 [Cloacibacterium rupense]